MFTTSPGNDSDPSLAELVRFSSQVLRRKKTSRQSSGSHETPWLRPNREPGELETNALLDAVPTYTSYAAPLMPLRERDNQVLSELFKQDGIDEIEADILNNLIQRFPEPCWEDDPLEFLEEYL